MSCQLEQPQYPTPAANSLTHSACPHLAAQCNAVLPCLSVVLGLNRKGRTVKDQKGGGKGTKEIGCSRLRVRVPPTVRV
jgi:hypothetical protein